MVLAGVAWVAHILVALGSINKEVPLFLDAYVSCAISTNVGNRVLVIDAGQFQAVIAIVAHKNKFAHPHILEITVNKRIHWINFPLRSKFPTDAGR
jgi:hypothetical protein